MKALKAVLLTATILVLVWFGVWLAIRTHTGPIWMRILAG